MCLHVRIALTTVLYCKSHRRRIKTEVKAKVVTAVWGTEFIKLFAGLAILHQNDLKNRMNNPGTT